jgi:hypothetical protein
VDFVTSRAKKVEQERYCAWSEVLHEYYNDFIRALFHLKSEGGRGQGLHVKHAVEFGYQLSILL